MWSSCVIVLVCCLCIHAIRVPAGTVHKVAKSLLESPRFSSLTAKDQEAIRKVAKGELPEEGTGTEALRKPQHKTARTLEHSAQYHTIVVGAGVGGLVTAAELIKRGVPPASILLLEALDRVGGRVENLEITSIPGPTPETPWVVEGGGTWIGPTQDEIAQLARDLDIGTFPTYYEPQTNAFDQLSPLAQQLADTIEAIAEDINGEFPWMSDSAGELDTAQFADFIAQAVGEVSSDEGVQEAVFTELFFPVTFSLSAPDDISALFMLWWLRSVGGFELVTGGRGGAQDLRFFGGSGRIPERLAWDLDRAGVRMEFNQFIDSVLQFNDGRIMLESSDDNKYYTRNLVLATGIGDRNRIQFSPQLSRAHREFAAAFPTGTSRKAFVVYDTPFWRDPSSPFKTDIPFDLIVNPTSQQSLPIYDYSPGEPGAPGVLATFPDGDDSPGEREAVLGAALDNFFLQLSGGATPPPRREYLEKTWNVDGGTWNCVGGFGAGVLTEFGEGWRKPAGMHRNIFFAGSGYATTHWGYIDGAVRSAKQTATDIIARDPMKKRERLTCSNGQQCSPQGASYLHMVHQLSRKHRH